MRQESASAIFIGRVTHTRFKPRKHSFSLKLGAYFIPIDNDESKVNKQLTQNSIRGRFYRSDYFGDVHVGLKQSVLAKSSELAEQAIDGKVYMLGQVRQLGYYFSPVNFYFIQAHGGEGFQYMLAEVTNTPWNEKHCYLVDLHNIVDHQKQFHVSPFNPMDMTYQWNVKASMDAVFVAIRCVRDSVTEFEASLNLKKKPDLKRNSMFTNFKIILGIYTHALVLFLKRNPVYDHPKRRKAS